MNITKDGKSNTYMSVNELGSTINVGKKGLILLLENGKKIELPNAEIHAKVHKGRRGYVYSAFIELIKEDIDLIINNPITDNRL